MKLIAHRAGDLAASTDPGPKTGKSFSTNLRFGSLWHELRDVRQRAFAIVAIVVEELDERGLALGLRHLA